MVGSRVTCTHFKHAAHPHRNACATALLLVGFEMLRRARHIKWGNVRYAFPAFLTMVTIPLTYSIAYGELRGSCTGSLAPVPACCRKCSTAP